MGLSFHLSYHGKNIRSEDYKNCFYKFKISFMKKPIVDRAAFVQLEPVILPVITDKELITRQTLPEYISSDNCLEIDVEVPIYMRLRIYF